MMGETTKSKEGLTTLDFIRSRIRSEVKKAGHTYESFAHLFNRTEGWFSNIVNGRRGLNVTLLLEIAEKLGVQPASLLPDSTRSETPKSFEEYIESLMMDIFEKKIIPLIKKEIEKSKRD